MHGVRDEFFYWASRLRSEFLVDNFIDVARRYVDSTKIAADAPLSDFEHAFWAQLAEDLGASATAWAAPTHDARALALQLATAEHFGLDATDIRYNVPDDLEVVLFSNTAPTRLALDTDTLFLAHMAWNSRDEVSGANGGDDLRLMLDVASAANRRKLGLAFDGSQDLLTYDGLDMGGVDFTVEALIKMPDPLPEVDTYILGQGAADAGSYGFLFSAAATGIVFVAITDVVDKSVVAVGAKAGDEYSVKGTVDQTNDEIALTINGIEIGSDTLDDPVPTNAGDLTVGGYLTSKWTGSIFDVRISGVIR